MNSYITAAEIKRLRKNKKLTQAQLADIIGVSSKTVSKWETAKGLPDISLIQPLADALSVSVSELMSGNSVTNNNTSSNIFRSSFYVCPVCNNIVYSVGEASISCCGITLSPLSANTADDAHSLSSERIEDEYYIEISHEMTKLHYISFAAYVSADRIQFVKFYPEGNAHARLKICGRGFLYFYCSKYSLMKNI